jgi:hypothetical protein
MSLSHTDESQQLDAFYMAFITNSRNYSKLVWYDDIISKVLRFNSYSTIIYFGLQRNFSLEDVQSISPKMPNFLKKEIESELFQARTRLILLGTLHREFL